LTVADGIITSEIQGTGTVYVAPGWRCRLQDGAKVRLDGDPNLPACSGTANAMQWGRILVEGDLHVSGGVVQQSNIEVRNDSTIASCGNGTGGRVILETDATLLCNHIISYDDRHLFIQPRCDRHDHAFRKRRHDHHHARYRFG
jgi:formylmethanofuran dehydrogenase subunit C